MIDNSGKIKGRVSIIDIILIAALVVLLAGFMYRQMSGRIGDIVRPSTPFEVIIQGEGLRHFIIDSVDVGDVMFRNHDRQPLGTVVAIDVEPSFDYLHRADGTATLAEMEGRYTIRLTLSSVGTVRANIGYFVNGIDHLAPGGEVALISNRVFIPDGRVYSIREVAN